MSFYLKIGFLSFWLLAAVHQCEQHTKTASPNEEYVEIAEETVTADVTEEKSFEDCSEITRQVLITHCGSCHHSTLATHKAGAIAVFDLDKNAQWHEDLSDHDLQGIANRIQNRSDLTDAQKEAIAVFVKQKEMRLSQ